MTHSLVTGGSGYFGSLLVERLLAAGHRVRILDLVPPDDPAADCVTGDIRDPAIVREAVDGIDLVFHNVAQVPLARDLELLESVNVTGTINLLDACRDAGVAKVIHTSSSAIFGVPGSNPVLPSTVPHPGEAYGQAKLEAEWACLRAASLGLDVSLIRPRTILGHGRLGIFGILFDWIADGADPLVLGDGSNRYQFVHADDLAEVCLLESNHSGPAILNVGTDRFGTIAEALGDLCAHAGTGSVVRRLPTAPAAAAMRAGAALGLLPFAPYHWMMYSKSMWFDIGHVTTRLDWRPKWSNTEMFIQSYDWYCSHRSATEDEAAAAHRRTARQGALRLLKSISKFAPRV
jgi:nucleoside-diphosphate-sugar epimerase